MRTNPLLQACIGLSLTLSFVACGSPPEIANVYPDYPGLSPQIITGESFDPTESELWVWEPPVLDRNVRDAVKHTGESVPELPATPPQGAHRVGTLDIEPRVITASIDGSVAWVKNKDGFSRPYLFNVAKPLWISEEKVEPGALVYIFGFGLRPQYRRAEFVLRSEATTLFPRVITEARSLRTQDKRLVYFEVPADAAAGKYEVYCHNSYGGAWGWQKAGTIEIVSRSTVTDKVFNVRDHGAKGDGLHNDFKAISQALQAAAKVRGVVFFPPGTYATDETLVVPHGVKLRGANRDSSIIQGIGGPVLGSRVAWFHSLTPPTAVLRLGCDTRLEMLSVQGATWKGEGGYGLVEAIADERTFSIGGEVRNVRIADCRLRALEEDAISRRPLYLAAFHAGPGSRRVKLLNNDIYGSAGWGIGGVGPAVRTDIIENSFHGGAVSDVVTINGSFTDSLIDANILTDTPGRIVLGMGWHNYVRYNEIHQAFRGTWENAEELYLVHGGVEAGKTVSFATGGSLETLVDTRQNWKPGSHRDSAVLILSGRGFGQYRRVVDNSANTLRLDKPWNVAPDATSEYLVAPQFIENAFFANLNNTPGRMSLWLDCIANQVEMHRDAHSKGSDLWGEDASQVDEKGVGHGLSKFFPAWYNSWVDCWMDGTVLQMGTPGAHENNAHVGYPNFGNYIVRNKIREAHAYRTGFDVNTYAGPAIAVGGGSGRAGSSHTIVAENFVGSTYTGIGVSASARKAFLLNNEFDHVDNPITDHGDQTVRQGNKLVGESRRDRTSPALADGRSERAMPVWQPKAWTPDQGEQLPPLFYDVLSVKQLVSQPAYCFGRNVESEECQHECRDHLRALFELIKACEKDHGQLPQATFFPEKTALDANSLPVLLRRKPGGLFICPTCSVELRGLGLNYVWNQKVGGKRLSEIKDPANTWLLMDFVGAHDWMTSNDYCGHRRGVNILYADGTVKWSPPFSTEIGGKSNHRWLDWARQ